MAPPPSDRRSTLAVARRRSRRSLATTAFVGNGGLQLGSSTLVEIGVIMIVGGARRGCARARRRPARPSTAAPRSPRSPALAGLTALSILWSLYPARLAGSRPTARSPTWPRSPPGIAAVRLARERWAAVLLGRSARARRRLPLRARDQGRARLAGLGRDLRPPARAVRVLERRRASPRRWAFRSASGSGRATRAGARRASLAYPLLGALHRDDAAELLAREHHRRRSPASRSGSRSCRCACAAWRCCCTSVAGRRGRDRLGLLARAP